MRLFRKGKAARPAEASKDAFDSFDDRSEENGSTTYGHSPVASGYGKRTGYWICVLAILIAVGLMGAFFAVSNIRARETTELEEQTAKTIATLPLVDVATVKPGPAYKSLMLPGETAAWYRTTLYSRVNGYLADWKVDIGDRVRAARRSLRSTPRISIRNWTRRERN